MRALAVPVFLLGVLSFAVADDKKNEDDIKASVGKWDVAKAELGGMDITEQIKTIKFEIMAGGKYTVVLGEKDEGTFTVDASKTPKEMDIKSTAGPNKGKLIKAIYKIDGDAMTICYELGGGDKRPTKFESKTDTKLFLVDYKRKK